MGFPWIASRDDPSGEPDPLSRWRPIPLPFALLVGEIFPTENARGDGAFRCPLQHTMAIQVSHDATVLMDFVAIVRGSGKMMNFVKLPPSRPTIDGALNDLLNGAPAKAQ